MNIFVLDDDIHKCAQYHNDRHCVKMILEYAQLLSTAHRVLNGQADVRVDPKTGKKKRSLKLNDARMDSVLYKVTHQNHPCAVWVRESTQNYHTLYNLFRVLTEEYEIRYGRKHKTARLLPYLATPPSGLCMTGRTPFPLCMPDQYKVHGNPVESYRNYYRQGKSHIANWKHRGQPEWYKLA